MTTAKAAMPYRSAHWYIVALAGVTVIGFWREYFAMLGDAVWSWHFHGIAASLWILLTGVQAWSIAAKRVPLHRRFGQASLIVFPVFFASMVTIVHTMAAATSPAHPFYRYWGGGLGVADSIGALAVGWLFFEALRRRRDMPQHARYMLAIPLFLLPPALERTISHYVPGFAMRGPQDFWFFRWDMHLANIVTIAIALALYRQAPRHGRAFAVTAALIGLQVIGFETIGQSQAWFAAFMAFGTVPAAFVVTAGLTLGAAITWAGWTLKPPPRSTR